MAISKEQAEVTAEALTAPVRQEQARLNRIHDADKRGINRPWVHIFSGCCFLLAGLSSAYVALNKPKPDALYWIMPAIFLLASVLQFAAFFWKRRGS